MSNQLPLLIRQGEYFKQTLKLATITNGIRTPIDLTGATFEGSIRASYLAPEVACDFTFTLLPQTGGTIGHVEVELVGDELDALELTDEVNYVYDMKYTKDSKPLRILQGIAVISPAVTKEVV